MMDHDRCHTYAKLFLHDKRFGGECSFCGPINYKIDRRINGKIDRGIDNNNNNNNNEFV